MGGPTSDSSRIVYFLRVEAKLISFIHINKAMANVSLPQRSLAKDLNIFCQLRIAVC